MKLTMIALSIAAVIASAPATFAQGVSSKQPGQETQRYGKKAGHRASTYAPSPTRTQVKRSRAGSPASGYAPGQTTGSNVDPPNFGGGGGGGGGY